MPRRPILLVFAILAGFAAALAGPRLLVAQTNEANLIGSWQFDAQKTAEYSGRTGDAARQLAELLGRLQLVISFRQGGVIEVEGNPTGKPQKFQGRWKTVQTTTSGLVVEWHYGENKPRKTTIQYLDKDTMVAVSEGDANKLVLTRLITNGG